MTPEAQRIAIAEACGLNVITSQDPRWCCYKKGEVHFALPDYFNDLNAMHEAEAILNVEQGEDFVAQLANAAQMKRTRATINSDYFIVAHATAAQRAEAFLRTLGLWQEQAEEQQA